MLYRLFRTLIDLESGRYCRRCGEPISRHDLLGQSEAVCPPCRDD